jgi:perosamine synthetase
MIPHSRPWILQEDVRSVEPVISSGFVAAGSLVETFEKEVAALHAVRGGVAVASGTAALTLALRALGLRSASEVILPTYVCSAVLSAVVAAGLKPVLCDVGDDGLINLNTAERCLTNHTAALIVVNLFGRMVDLAPLRTLEIPIIEDSCQAFGVPLASRVSTGDLGLGILSFHATKAITTGEGGMVVCHDFAFLERLRGVRDGLSLDTGFVSPPLSDLQAALGVSQLRRYPEMLARRREIGHRYASVLSGSDVIFDSPERISSSAAFRFVIRSAVPFEKVCRAFAMDGITVRRGVDKLLHRSVGQDPTLFPVAERLFAESVSIPIYPALREHEVERIAATLAKVFGLTK